LYPRQTVLAGLTLRRSDVDEPQAAVHFLGGIDGIDGVAMEARGAAGERGQHEQGAGNGSHANG
jgi:hypothetical protein